MDAKNSFGLLFCMILVLAVLLWVSRKESAELAVRVTALESHAPVAAKATGCPHELDGLHFSHSIAQRPYRNADAMLTCFYRKAPPHNA